MLKAAAMQPFAVTGDLPIRIARDIISLYTCFLIQISDINRLRSILYADKAKESEAELCIAPCCR